MATWTYWGTTCSGTSASTTDCTWDTWTTSGTSATTTDTWTNWDDAYTPYSVYTYTPIKRDRLLIHYERMQQKINLAWRQIIADRLKEDRAEAETTAKALLLDLVSQKEFDLYEKTGRLLVKGRKQSYIVKKHGGVDIVLNNDKIKDLCVHLNSASKYPETDNVIAMKLHIEQAEEEFLKTANHYSPRNLGEMEKFFLKAVKLAS
ncbi:MAG TPA: hypothetical protein VMW95_05875 [Desulfobacterales bacterium]|nr:hypothetical protein [Desulfobacterales bacterium]